MATFSSDESSDGETNQEPQQEQEAGADGGTASKELEVTGPSFEDKHQLFVELLKAKIKNWYEVKESVLPWKKVGRLTTSDVFVPCGVRYFESRSRRSQGDIDSQCRMRFQDIFTHEDLKRSEGFRILLEGDPGTGRTTDIVQLANQWRTGEFGNIGAFIILPLRAVPKGMTLMQAIRKVYVPEECALTEGDIEAIIDSKEVSSWLFLEDYSHYVGQEMESVMANKERKYPNCRIVLSAGVDRREDLLNCPVIKPEPWGEQYRMNYINKVVPGDVGKRRLNESISSRTMNLDICSVPMLFVLAIHSIPDQNGLRDDQFKSFTHFVKYIIEEMHRKSDEEGKGGSMSRNLGTIGSSSVGASSVDRSTPLSIEELAYNGLVSGSREVFWGSDFIAQNVADSERWIECGILVVDDFVQEAYTDNDGRYTDPKISKDIVQETPEGEQSEEKVNDDPKDSSPSTGMDTLDVAIGSQEREQGDEAMEVGPSDPLPSAPVDSSGGQGRRPLRFLSTIIREWFAARYFVGLFRGSTAQEEQRFADDLLRINPADMLYILRFTSSMCPESFHKIVAYLLKRFRTTGYGEKKIPGYIINHIAACFIEYDVAMRDGGAIEYERAMDENLKGPMTEVCAEKITMDYDDNKLEQQCKIAMLEAMSRAGVPIKMIKIIDVVALATPEYLELDHGVRLGRLSTVEMLKVRRWDREIENVATTEIIKYVANNGIQSSELAFPTKPPILEDEDTSNKITLRNAKVQWKVGYYALDLCNGREWRLEKRCQEIMESIAKSNADRGPANLRTERVMTSKGGVLEIPDGNVRIEFPEGALEEDCLIEMRVIPRWKLYTTAFSFATNTPGVVELLPVGLVLRKPAKLTFPHAGCIMKDAERKVTVTCSFHPYGCKPLWREQRDVASQLDDETCTVWLKKFGWVTFEFPDKVVEGKRIRTFVARGQGIGEDFKHVEVGYYIDLPGERNMLRRNNVHIVSEKPYAYYNEGRVPLSISLDKIEPEVWDCVDRKDLTKNVSWESLAIIEEYSCSYILKRTGDTDAILYLTVYQGERPPAELQLFMKGKGRYHHHNGGGPDAPVTQPAMLSVARHVKTELDVIGRRLGVEQAQIDTFRQRDPDDPKEVGYQVLYYWRNTVAGEGATFRVLMEALQHVERIDLVELLLDYYAGRDPGLAAPSFRAPFGRNKVGGIKRSGGTRTDQASKAIKFNDGDGSGRTTRNHASRAPVSSSDSSDEEGPRVTDRTHPNKSTIRPAPQDSSSSDSSDEEPTRIEGNHPRMSSSDFSDSSDEELMRTEGNPPNKTTGGSGLRQPMHSSDWSDSSDEDGPGRAAGDPQSMSAGGPAPQKPSESSDFSDSD